MNKNEILKTLEEQVKGLYEQKHSSLQFHGWHHVYFVYKMASVFAVDLNADSFLVGIAALTHDLNYIVKTRSEVNNGHQIRKKMLKKVGLESEQIQIIEKVIIDASIENRDNNISAESKALSDADTLFKALPTTIILFSHLYILEQEITIEELAKRIVTVQSPLINKGIYFYSKSAKKYQGWAVTNLQLWKNVEELYTNSEMALLIKNILKHI